MDLNLNNRCYDLNDVCDKCGFIGWRHHNETGACPKSRKKHGTVEIPGMRYLLKGEFKKHSRFTKNMIKLIQEQKPNQRNI